MELTKLICACTEVGFFYLDLTPSSAGKMLRNLNELQSVMEEWFAQSRETKLETETVSNSHGYVATSLQGEGY